MTNNQKFMSEFLELFNQREEASKFSNTIKKGFALREVKERAEKLDAKIDTEIEICRVLEVTSSPSYGATIFISDQLDEFINDTDDMELEAFRM